MTQYPPQDNTAGGNSYGYSNQGSSQDYYQGQPPSYGQQAPQYGQQAPQHGQQPPQYGQHATPGPQEYNHSPQPGHQPSPQPSYSQPPYGSSDQGREHAQSYNGTNEQAYQQYPHDRPAQQYGSSDYNHQGPAASNYPPPQHQQQQQYGAGYDNQQQYPPQPTYGSSSAPGYDQNYRQDPSQQQHNYPNTQYNNNPQYGAPPPGPYGAPQPGTEDRGLMGALAGGAAGGFAGHKMNHGILGTLGGAVAGSMLEDAYKDKKHKKPKKEKKHKKSRRGSSSSSSSSSDSDSGESPHALAGNFSASSRGVRLEDDGRTLVAECCGVNGHHRESRLDLNACLTNTNGSLRWARGGNFRASARGVWLSDGGRVLEAELGDGRGGWVRDRVRLDERIENSDGRLGMI